LSPLKLNLTLRIEQHDPLKIPPDILLLRKGLLVELDILSSLRLSANPGPRSVEELGRDCLPADEFVERDREADVVALAAAAVSGGYWKWSYS
jgi:hypothetical protein